jgi:hypothetical protein
MTLCESINVLVTKGSLVPRPILSFSLLHAEFIERLGMGLGMRLTFVHFRSSPNRMVV